MDRYARPESSSSLPTRGWLRATVLAAALAGAGIGSGVGVPTAALAQAEPGRSMSVPVAAEAPERYVVKRGDTLWDISALYLKDPWYWPEIWHVNPSIANPHLIYPGDVLYFSYVDGKPRVSLERAGAVRLSPEVRTSPLDQAIRAIPYDVLVDFAGRPSVIDKSQLKNAPYVVGMRDRHIVGSSHNEIYGRGLDNPAPGTRFNIVNVGEPLRDPDDGDLLGYMGHFAGVGEVMQSTGAVVPGKESIFSMKREEDLAHLKVLEIGREIMQGDKLFPATVDVGPDFVISLPKNEGVLGQVVAIVEGVSVAGKYQVLALNRGSKHGLEAGNALGVFYRGEVVHDRFDRGVWSAYTANYDKVRLPDERSATVLVFKVYDRVSYALVMESSQVIHKGDFIASPMYGHRDAGNAVYLP
ncbi:MAG TPA: LysM peptidoglycan-binding domain-containing protein [Steroidobacteraceae bacterium]|nr:LysM peptidoglycan-binding domain-containing protein [Steroidobacteraceae bacterium]